MNAQPTTNKFAATEAPTLAHSKASRNHCRDDASSTKCWRNKNKLQSTEQANQNKSTKGLPPGNGAHAQLEPTHCSPTARPVSTPTSLVKLAFQGVGSYTPKQPN